MSRPSSFSDEISNTICDRLANGESLVEICNRPDMPSRSSVIRWINANPEFAAMCGRARQEQGDYLFDEIARVESDVEAGRLPPDVARVLISSKQWRASKLAPKRYGDRTTVESTSTVRVEPTRKLDISQLSDLELDALENALRVTVMQLAAPKVIEHEE
jgi:hypothetical protein